jgi:branched-chain amino acid transport system substrate-binding protein
MKKYLGIILAIIVVIVGILIFSQKETKSQTSEKQTVKIGLSLPLSGGVAFLGEPAKKAAELALKDAGKTKYNYELVFEDDQFSPKIAASTASKLINVDKVLAIIEFGSGTGNAINSIAEKGQTVEFALASDPTVAKGVYNYVHWTPPFKEGQLLAQELIQRGYKKVSIIDTNHPGPLAVTDAVKEFVKGSGVEIVSYDLTNIGEKDFKTIITKIKKANPDIVILEMFSPEIEIAARQMKELGVNIPVTSVETFEWSSNPELFEGSWFVSDSIVPNFTAKFKSAYGTDPQAGSSYVYDLVSLLIKLQEKSDTVIAPKDLPAAITQMGDWNSPVFGQVKIDSEGFFITEPSVKMIKDGKVISAQ